MSGARGHRLSRRSLLRDGRRARAAAGRPRAAGARARRRRDARAREPPRPDATRRHVHARAAVRPPRRRDDGEPLVRQRARGARAIGPARRRRTELRRRRPRPQQQSRRRRPGALVPVHHDRSGVEGVADLERDPPADRRRPDGRLRPLGRRRVAADGLLGRRGAAVRVLAREHVRPRQPLVLLGAVPDDPQPPLPARRVRVRLDRDRPREPRQPPPHGTIFDRLHAHGISWRNYYSDVPQTAIIPQSSSATARTSHRSRASTPTAAAARCPRSASSTRRSAAPSEARLLLSRLPGILGRLVAALPAGSGADEEAPEDLAPGEAGPTASSRRSCTPRRGRGRADLPLRRARRLLRPRAAAGGDRARFDRAGARPGRRARRVRHLRPARPRRRRLALLEAERRLERGPRPHLGAGDDRGAVEPAGVTYRDANAATVADLLDPTRAAFHEPPAIAAPLATG